MEFLTKLRSRVIIESYRDWIAPNSKILDIGCGNMVVTNEIKNHFQSYTLGVDIKDRRKKEMPFKIFQRKKLPFKDKEFDVATLNDVLHHIGDLGIINEAQRVAEKVLIFEMEPNFFIKVIDLILNAARHRDFNIAPNIKTAEEWKKILPWADYKKCRRPCWWYPFDNFTFLLQDGGKNEKALSI